MAQLPDQLGRLDRARRLPLAEPLDHPLCVAGGAGGGGVRGGGGLDEEMAEDGERGRLVEESRRRGGRRDGFVVADVARFDEGGADVEGVGLVQHALDQSLHRVFGGAEWAQSWDTQGAGCAAEDQVSPSASAVAVGVGPFAEVWEGELDYVEGAPEIRFELVSDLIVILVFASTDDAVARAISYDVHPPPVFQALCEDVIDG